MKTIYLIQHADANRSARDYEAGETLRVTSVFRTIQGEGPLAGRTAIFIRLSGCNYGDRTKFCAFCDTSFEFEQGKVTTFEELEAQMVAAGARSSDVLVVTGGEPTLQHNLVPFLNRVYDAFEEVQLETNGTQPKFFDDLHVNGERKLIRDLNIVVSPKANYQINKYPKIADTVFAEATCLKYVLSADPEDAHHTVPSDVMAEAVDINTPVYVSPMTVYARPYSGEVSSIWDEGLIDKEATARNYAYTAAYALEHNLRVSVQMHTFLGIA